jgi:sugar lactone lactonase YvrE
MRDQNGEPGPGTAPPPPWEPAEPPPWEVVVAAGAELGGRPVWDPSRSCLTWVDIKAGRRRGAPLRSVGRTAGNPSGAGVPAHLPGLRGPGLEDLFVTTAWLGMDDQQRAAEPLAGHLLRTRPGTAGFPAGVFAG